MLLLEYTIQFTWRVIELKKGDRFELDCGHKGKIVLINVDSNSFYVRGVRRGCSICGKGSKDNWTPTIYIYSLKE